MIQIQQAQPSKKGYGKPDSQTQRPHVFRAQVEFRETSAMD